MLEWKTFIPERKSLNQLYLIYRAGYPLTVAMWKTGYGFIDIKSDMTILEYDYIAEINLPK